MRTLLRRARHVMRSDAGASAVEYGLLIVAIAAVIALVVFAFGTSVFGLYGSSCDTIYATTC